MKKFLLLFSSCFIISCVSQHTQKNIPKSAPDKQVFYDENSNEISKNLFLIKWRAKELGLARWDHIENNVRYSRLSQNLFITAQLDYQIFFTELQKMTKELPSNSIFLIQYNFKDDLCSPSSSNQITKATIRDRKKFFGPQIREMKRQHKNLIFLNIYEKGMDLANKPNNTKEYTFSDKNNVLKESLFKNPILCGSLAIVKPNGQALIRNGEYSPIGMAAFLEDERWKIFFPAQ